MTEVRRAHLFVPMLHRRDAVGEHTRALRDRFAAVGVASRIYTDLPDPETAHETSPYLDYGSDARPGDILVYQFATASDMAGWLARRPEPVVVNYHSVTPPRFFEAWSNPVARLQVRALAELHELAPTAALGIVDSAYDGAGFRRAGCAAVEVVPVAHVAVPGPEAGTGRAGLDGAGPDGAKSDGARWLTVGRLAPNKAHHHVIAALFAARETTDPGARLTIVGSPSIPSYAAALHRYVEGLGLTGAVELVSGLSDAALARTYECSDVLVLLSDHEGFGVPLVEAMARGLPVVAYAAGAVAETAGGGAVLLEDKSPRRVARAVADLLADPDRRHGLVAAGLRRVDELGLAHAAARIVERVLAAGEGALPGP